MFNARAIATGDCALRIKGCRGFILIALLVFFGQLLIVSFGGRLFNVTPLSWRDWLMVIVATSFVLWIGELCRWKKLKNFLGFLST
jgi:Ca2+-transporting ATPase